MNGTLKVTPAEATVTTGSASKAYDGVPLTRDEASITGLALGETATVTATGSITDIGTAQNTYTIDWGSTNADNYTVTETLGTLEVTASTAEITFTAASSEKVYDGIALTDSTVTVSGLPAGFTYEATVSGSQTDAGESGNVIASYKIFNAENADVTASFTDIATVNGTLKVTKAEATVTTGSASKAYDGTALTNSEATATGLVADETVTVTATGSITDIGTAQNTYSIDWGSTNKENYTVTESLGTLEVTTKAVTITADSGSKAYDGTALTKNSYTNTALAAGDCIGSVTVTGSQTAVGSSGNVPSAAKIVNAAGDDVTASYEITYESGTLEVTSNDTPITVTANSFSEVYDGYAHSGWYSVTVEGVPEGLSYVADPEFFWTDVGTYTLTPFIDLYDKDDNFVNGNFTNIKLVNGTLTVTPAALTVTTGSATKVYDGTALTNSEASISGLDGKDKGKVTVTATGTITYVGSTPNTYTIDWGEVNPDNYTLTENLGTLEISVPMEEPVENVSISKKVTSTPANGIGYTLGETITYDITAENVGNVSANFIVIDELTGKEWTTGILAPAESKTFNCSYVVTEADIEAGNVMGLRTM